MAGAGRSEAHTAGRCGWPKIAQRRSWVNWMQGMPAGLPAGMPGIALLIEGAMQQAAQAGRQSMMEWIVCGKPGPVRPRATLAHDDREPTAYNVALLKI